MEVELLQYPTEQDWMMVKRCALVTIGKQPVTEPDMDWKKRMLEARHSPIRELKFVFYLHNVPSWVATHLCRHVHTQPYVKSQRNDRQDEYDRNAARQDAPVDMIWSMDAEALMIVANKRLCKLAAEETRNVVKAMCDAVLEVCPEFEGNLVKMCRYHGGECHEMYPCYIGVGTEG